MIYQQLQLFYYSLSAISFVSSDSLQLSSLDSEQEYEMHDLEANIDPETGVRRYDNYQLLRALPSTEEHVDILHFLEKGKNMFS